MYCLAMIRNIDVGIARAFLAVVETGSVTRAAREVRLASKSNAWKIYPKVHCSSGLAAGWP